MTNVPKLNLFVFKVPNLNKSGRLAHQKLSTKCKRYEDIKDNNRLKN